MGINGMISKISYPIALIFLLIISPMFVAVKPLPLVNGQNFATIPNGNTEGMGSAPISGNSSAIATKPEILKNQQAILITCIVKLRSFKNRPTPDSDQVKIHIFMVTHFCIVTGIAKA